MNQFWSAGISELQPYTPGEQPAGKQCIKLNTNESPFGPSPVVLSTIRSVTTEALRLYPEPTSYELRHTLATYYSLKPEELFVGNGSDEVLAFSFRAFLMHQRPLLFPDITYSFYLTYCKLFGIAYQQIPLTDKLEIDLDAYQQPNGGIIFPNPNAPTGIGLPLTAIERLVQRHPNVVVVIDEAYVDFGAESAIPLIHHYPNLLVVKTLSKSRSLAGLRVGFAAGHATLIDALNRVKNSFNSYPLDRIAQAAAIASYQDEEYFRANCAAIQVNRVTLCKTLSEIGFDVLPSLANFVFARHRALPAAMLARRLHRRSIFVRHFNQPRIHDYLRITVGTEADCATLISALREIIENVGKCNG